MSDTVPTFKKGDHVRIMQTPTTVGIGLAGLRGVVMRVHGDLCDVSTAGCGSARLYTGNVPAACLSHVGGE